MTVKTPAAVVAVLLFLSSGCGGDAVTAGEQQGEGQVREDVQLGATAVWDVDPAQPPSVTETSFTALVSRLGCANGETGQVFEPEVVEQEQTVVVTFAVQALPEGAYTCPSNQRVAQRVTLAAPIGDRRLVDGACLSGEAMATSHCFDSAQRWPSATE